MRKLEIANAEIMRIAIQQEIARSDVSRYDHRLHGLLLLTSGQSCQQIADPFGEDRRTLQRWVKRFEQDLNDFGYKIDPAFLNGTGSHGLG